VLVTTGGAIAYANARALDLLFMGERQLRGMRRSEMLSLLASFTDARPEALRDIASAAMERGPRSFDLSIHAPQRRVLRWQTRRIEVGEHQGLVDEIVDVTKEATATDAREKLVRLDELTQLPNRRAGEEALGRSISWSLRTGGLLSVGLFEIDSLDVFESAIARQVFRATAWLLRDALRGYDLAVRHGPRLLLAILPGIAAAQMSAFGERFRTAVERTRIEGLPPVTVSGGIAQFDGVQDGAQLVAAAAAALEAARARGGNAVV
jgi:diguanylate cyclase (GGDEF)-like protein